ncbi:MAG: response regulator, partial [Pirellulaceae bacterium]
MNDEVVLLIVEDDDGHARLIEKNLRRAGVKNKVLRFWDGQEILDFLFRRGEGRKREAMAAYLLLLDI